jgi:hypothetical protein
MFPQIFNLQFAKPSSPKDDIIIDRTTKWGNPYHVHSYGRPLALKLYRAYLWNRIQNNEISLTELAKLANKNLWCWCKPKDCHGDILLEAAKWAELSLRKH